MAVDTQNNQTTDETQQIPQPPDQTDSDQDQPSTEAPAEEQPVDSELNAENADTYDSNQPEPDLTEIEAVLSASQTNDDQPENLERILNMKVPIIVQIAKKKMKAGELMKLNIGTVIQFDQDAYQSIDLMVNNEVIGLGQPVKIGENFGLKITQLGDITHTIKSLGQASDSETF